MGKLSRSEALLYSSLMGRQEQGVEEVLSLFADPSFSGMCLSTAGSSIGTSRFLQQNRHPSLSQLCTWDPWLWQILEQGEVIH